MYQLTHKQIKQSKTLNERFVENALTQYKEKDNEKSYRGSNNVVRRLSNSCRRASIKIGG